MNLAGTPVASTTPMTSVTFPCCAANSPAALQAQVTISGSAGNYSMTGTVTDLASQAGYRTAGSTALSINNASQGQSAGIFYASATAGGNDSIGMLGYYQNSSNLVLVLLSGNRGWVAPDTAPLSQETVTCGAPVDSQRPRTAFLTPISDCVGDQGVADTQHNAQQTDPVNQISFWWSLTDPYGIQYQLLNPNPDGTFRSGRIDLSAARPAPVVNAQNPVSLSFDPQNSYLIATTPNSGLRIQVNPGGPVTSGGNGGWTSQATFVGQATVTPATAVGSGAPQLVAYQPGSPGTWTVLSANPTTYGQMISGPNYATTSSGPTGASYQLLSVTETTPGGPVTMAFSQSWTTAQSGGWSGCPATGLPTTCLAGYANLAGLSSPPVSTVAVGRGSGAVDPDGTSLTPVPGTSTWLTVDSNSGKIMPFTQAATGALTAQSPTAITAGAPFVVAGSIVAASNNDGSVDGYYFNPQSNAIAGIGAIYQPSSPSAATTHDQVGQPGSVPPLAVTLAPTGGTLGLGILAPGAPVPAVQTHIAPVQNYTTVFASSNAYTGIIFNTPPQPTVNGTPVFVGAGQGVPAPFWLSVLTQLPPATGTLATLSFGIGPQAGPWQTIELPTMQYNPYTPPPAAPGGLAFQGQTQTTLSAFGNTPVTVYVTANWGAAGGALRIFVDISVNGGQRQRVASLLADMSHPVPNTAAAVATRHG